MSKFYGTLVSDKGASTRAGHREIAATAQTADGSVTVDIGPGIDGKNCVSIFVRKGSGVGGFCLGEWPLEKLVQAEALAIKKRRKA